MLRSTLACLAFALMAGSVAGAARAQVPQPAAEPGSVPEAQSPPAQVQPAPRPRGPVRMSSGVVAGLKVGGDHPVYPADAKAQGISGSVVLHAIIGKDGHIESLVVVSGNELLAAAALDAVKTWTYRPYMLNGEPTEVDTTITVNFNLSEGPRSRPENGPLRISGGVMRGLLEHEVAPVDPTGGEASGTVVLHAMIGNDGHVESLAVLTGPEVLQKAALDAVKQWTYRPYLLNGRAVEVETTITVNIRRP